MVTLATGVTGFVPNPASFTLSYSVSGSRYPFWERPFIGEEPVFWELFRVSLFLLLALVLFIILYNCIIRKCCLKKPFCCCRCCQCRSRPDQNFVVKTIEFAVQDKNDLSKFPNKIQPTEVTETDQNRSALDASSIAMLKEQKLGTQPAPSHLTYMDNEAGLEDIDNEF